MRTLENRELIYVSGGESCTCTCMDESLNQKTEEVAGCYACATKCCYTLPCHGAGDAYTCESTPTWYVDILYGLASLGGVGCVIAAIAQIRLCMKK